MTVVKNRCRCWLNTSCEKKNCSTTWSKHVKTESMGEKIGDFRLASLQTNSSNGKVVNMFNPKANRATLIRVSFYNKERNVGSIRTGK